MVLFSFLMEAVLNSMGSHNLCYENSSCSYNCAEKECEKLKKL